MAIARVDILVNWVREVSLTTGATTTSGVQDAPIIFFLNQAVNEIQKAVVREMAEAFVAFKEVSITADTESYSTPTDIFAHSLVYGVQYSHSGDTDDYEDLELSKGRCATGTGAPEEYSIEGGVIYLFPHPLTAQGKIRIRYEKRLDRMDKRRGKVSSRTIGASELLVTSITLDSTADDDALDDPPEYVCVCDRYGTMKMRNIKVDSYDTASNLITVVSGFSGETGESVAVGDYVTIGANTTTHTQLNDIAEDFLITYAQEGVFGLQSSTDIIESSAKLKRLRNDIVEVYAQLPSGIVRPAEIRGGY